MVHANILTKNQTILYQWANELPEEILREHNIQVMQFYCLLLFIEFYNENWTEQAEQKDLEDVHLGNLQLQKDKWRWSIYSVPETGAIKEKSGTWCWDS